MNILYSVCAIYAAAQLLASSVAPHSIHEGGASPTPLFEQHFAPSENLETIDVARLDAARASIDMAAFVLTDRPVIAALTRAARRRVRVRLYRQIEDYDPSRATAAAIAELEQAGAAIRYKDPTRPLMHLKAYCVDETLLRVGAANFSRSGLTRQNNDLELARGAGVCAAFDVAFARMWGDK